MDILNNLGCLETDVALEDETFSEFSFDNNADNNADNDAGNAFAAITVEPGDPGPSSSSSSSPQQQQPPSFPSPHLLPARPPSSSSSSSSRSVGVVPLRDFIRDESSLCSLGAARHATVTSDDRSRRRERSVLRKTTAAYAIAELLCHHFSSTTRTNTTSDDDGSIPTTTTRGSEGCRMDNFVVVVSANDRGGEDREAVLEGVDMISPPLSLRLISPFFLSDEFWSNDGDGDGHGDNDCDDDDDDGNANANGNRAHRGEALGRYLEVEIRHGSTAAGGPTSREESDPSPASPNSASEENAMCYLLGTVLYELYSQKFPSPRWTTTTTRSGSIRLGGDSDHTFSGLDLVGDSGHSFFETSADLMGESGHSLSEMQPPCKKAPFAPSLDGSARSVRPVPPPNSTAGAGTPSKPPGATHVPLKDLGIPASLSLLVENLLDCGWDDFRPDDAFPSLAAARDDLHLLLLDPRRFLFDRSLAAPRSLDVGRGNVLYGREAERSLLVDVFCRVTLTGDSEALLVGGHSGSGKSALVASVLEYVDVAGGYVAREKFDPSGSKRPMSAVIDAFDALCPVVKARNSEGELRDIVTKLRDMFGTHLSALARLLPRVELLIPGLDEVCSRERRGVDGQGNGAESEFNLGSVYFILQLFTRVVSSKSHPIMLFLDDLHWADSASIDVLQCIMSDPYGCIYLVGSYRINEVCKDHAVFRLMNVLEPCNVQLTKVHLDGMEIEDVNRMISDALGVLPRICRPLSQAVLRKTKGNPLFVLECLRSLVDRNLLQYSVRERRWMWDTDAISEEDIADNVCELLSIKMIGLPVGTQLALKIAACFGTTLDLMVVETMTSSSRTFANFQKELENAVDEGFMDKNCPGSSYRFVHDKVREAAYGLIKEEDRNEFHSSIGKLLHLGSKGEKLDNMIFFIVDQINHGTTIDDPQQRIDTAELNYKAASKAMSNSNIAAAYLYINAAIELLPPDHWESHYELSRSIFLVLGNTAYKDGQVKGGMRALDSILEHGKSLKDKLDAYYLKIALLHSRQELKLAYDTSVEVLEQLGESIPTSVEPEIVADMVSNIQSKLNGMTESDLMNTKTMDSPLHYSLMQFYNHVCHMSFFVHNKMLKWYACRLVEISFEHGFCKYSALGIMRYSMVLGGKLIRDAQGSYRVGKMALKLLDRFDATDLLPSIFLCYYGFIAVHIEPFQSCADMLKRGCEIALSMGDTTTAFMIAIQYIQKSFYGGTNLSVLKKECDYQMRLIEAQDQPVTKMYMSGLGKSIAMLIANEKPANPNRSDGDLPLSEELSETLIFHGVLQNFWLGRFDRCIYYAHRASAISDVAQLKGIMTSFYGGLACFRASKKSDRKRMKLAKEAVRIMREGGEKSLWNYQCKIHLLEAEMLSARGKKDMANVSFNAAISAAKSSKFIHEQGLACELAALHCLKHGDKRNGKSLFEQARECYTKWGSQVKVDYVAKELQKMSSPTPLEEDTSS